MSDIFLSYAHEDRERVFPLVDALEREGWSVWWDWTIPPGTTFPPVIQEALDEARCVLVLWSNASVGSEWVNIEASEGKRRHILIAVMIDDLEVDQIPLEFRQIHIAQLLAGDNPNASPEFAQVRKRAGELLSPPLMPIERLPEELRTLLTHDNPVIREAMVYTLGAWLLGDETDKSGLAREALQALQTNQGDGSYAGPRDAVNAVFALAERVGTTQQQAHQLAENVDTLQSHLQETQDARQQTAEALQGVQKAKTRWKSFTILFGSAFVVAFIVLSSLVIGRLPTVETERDEWRQRFNILKVESDTATTQSGEEKKALSAQLNTLTNRLTTATTEKTRTQRDLAEAMTQERALKDQLKTLETQLATATTAKEHAEAARLTAQQQTTEAQADATQAKRDAVTAQQVAAAARRDVDPTRESLGKAEEALARARAQEQALKERVETLGAQLATATADKDQAEATQREAHAQLKQLRKQLTQSQQAHDQVVQQQRATTQQLQVAHAARADAEQRAANLLQKTLTLTAALEPGSTAAPLLPPVSSEKQQETAIHSEPSSRSIGAAAEIVRDALLRKIKAKSTGSTISSVNVRRVFGALEKQLGETAIDEILPYLQDKDPLTRWKAIKLLVYYKYKGYSRLRNFWENESKYRVRKVVLETTKYLPIDQRITLLADIVRLDDTYHIRSKAVEILSRSLKTGKQEYRGIVIPILIDAALYDDHEYTRAAAFRALLNLRVDADKAVEVSERQLLEDSKNNVRIAAADFLAELGSIDSASEVFRAFAQELINEYVFKKFLAKFIQRFGSDWILSEIKKIKNPETRKTVEQVFIRIPKGS